MLSKKHTKLLDFHTRRYYSLNYYFNNISLEINNVSACYEFNLFDKTIRKHKNLITKVCGKYEKNERIVSETEFQTQWLSTYYRAYRFVNKLKTRI